MSREIVRGFYNRTSKYAPFEREDGWYYTNPKGVDEGPFESEWDAKIAEDWWHV